MTSFPKTYYWRNLVPNYESVVKTTNPYFKIFAPHLLRKMKQSLFWFLKSICLSILVITATYKNMKKFLIEIFKRTRSGKLYSEEASYIEVCVNSKIQEKFNLAPKNSLVDYANMLLPLTKNMQGKK